MAKRLNNRGNAPVESDDKPHPDTRQAEFTSLKTRKINSLIFG
jgi:hypothetical protein